MCGAYWIIETIEDKEIADQMQHGAAETRRRHGEEAGADISTADASLSMVSSDLSRST
jgi:hypothetical protein